MTEAKRAAPRIPPEPDDMDMDLPPPRVPEPGEGRETVFHWIITVGGFAAMLLIGLLFTD